MIARIIRSVLPLLVAFVTLLAAVSAVAAEVPRMSSDKLRSRLGEAGLVVLDSRSVPDWQRAVLKIKGAVRVDPGSVEMWAGDYDRHQTIVLYCA